MMLKKYIHYGDDQFHREYVVIPRSHVDSKPDRGLWASPVNAKFGWKEWCEAEDFYKNDFSKYFTFVLEDSANILNVYNESDILPYVIRHPFLPEFVPENETIIGDALDLDKLYTEFDGIELFLSDNCALHNGIFNVWDCDSIVVWNPDVIKVI